MARLLYGATSGDYTMTAGGRVIPNAEIEIWDAIEGGTQVTDLTDYDGNPCTVVTSGADGLVRFYGPDGENDNLWMDSRQGSRLLARPTVLTASIGDGSILDEDIAADADIDRTKIAGTALTEADGVGPAALNIPIGVWDDYTGRADAPLTEAHVTRSGHPITLFAIGDDFAIDGGSLTHPITTGTTAAYLGVEAAAVVRDMRVQVKWTDAAEVDDEVAVMIVSGSPFTVEGYADAGAHVLIYRDQWVYQTYAAGVGPTMLDSGTFPELPYGVWHTFRLTYDVYQPTLWFPDGSTHTVAYSSTITARWGAHATFELFSTGDQNPAALRAWAFSPDVILDIPVPVTGVAEHIEAPTTAITSITGGFVVVDTLTVVVPSSKVLHVIAMEYVVQGAGNLYAQVDVAGNGTATQIQLLEYAACDRTFVISAVLDLSDFTVGTSQTLNVRLFSAASSAEHRLNSGEHKRQSIVAVPLFAAAFA